MKMPLVIFGAAEIAQLAKFYFDHDSNYQVVAFTVDDEYVEESELLGLPVIPFSQVTDRFSPSNYEMFVALSYTRLNKLREEKYFQAKNRGYTLASYVCSKSVSWPDLQIGDNCFILENQTIQPTVRIGNNVMLWSGNHIGHGSVISDHAYISSHVVVSGHCNIGKNCFLGVNSTIKDFITIGDDCFVAMDGAVVLDLANGSVVLGSKSEALDASDRRARMLKRKYFGV